MKKQLLIFGVIIILITHINARAQKKSNANYLDFKSVVEMYDYFAYAPNKKIISGHRGTIEHALPENSIVGFNAVLKHTNAIFEIDPRLTKDGVVVLMHDETLDRTTNGTGKVGDYTWKELKKLRLKDANGNITKYRIETLDEVIKWARGKAILNLDKKDLPLDMTAEIIRKHNAYAWVWVTVHNVAQAKFYLQKNPDQYLSMHLKDQQALALFKDSGLPFNRMIAYIGPEIKPANKPMYEFLNAKGVMCMISSAPTYDKLKTKEARAEKYKAVFDDGASILESDLPIEASSAIR